MSLQTSDSKKDNKQTQKRPLKRTRSLKLDQEQGPLSHQNEQFALADTIQIIKTDGTVLCSYQTRSHLQIMKIDEIRKEVIDYSRKLNIQTYEKQINQLLVNGFYVYFKFREGAILYVVACSSFSFQAAEEFMNKLINIYDETMIEIFGQCRIPRQVSKSHMNKLGVFKNKIEVLIKLITAQMGTKGGRIVKKTETFVDTISEISHKIEQRTASLRNIEHNTQKLLTSSQQIKRTAKRLQIWMAIKKYIIFVFFFACIMISFYLFQKYY